MSDYAVTTRIAPWFTFGADRSLRLVYRNLRAAKRYWLVMVSGFFEPLFYLVGLGIGVGALVGEISYGGQSIAYEEFVAPALLAASAMNGAIYETTGNVFFKLNYAKTYDGVLATPLGVRDIAVGETIFALMRGTVYSVASAMRRKTLSRMSRSASAARSLALEWLVGSSRPMGFEKLVSSSPRRCALEFIRSTNRGTEPETPSAMVTAESLALARISE